MNDSLCPLLLSRIMKNTLLQFLMKTTGKQAFTQLFKGAEDPIRQQKKLLLSIIKRNANSQYGQQHHFSQIHSIEEFQEKVPVVQYDQLRELIKEHTQQDGNGLISGQAHHFINTSGSTGDRKLIAVSDRGNKFIKLFNRASQYMIQMLESSAYEHKMLVIAQPNFTGQTKSSIDFGSATSGFEHDYPKLLKDKLALHDSTFEIEDFDSRYYCMLRQSVEQSLSIIETQNPSTLILLAHFMMKWEKELIEDIFRGTIQKKFQSVHTDEILKSLKPNPKLAHHLRAMITQSEYKTLTPQMVWPDLKIIVCWTQGNCGHYLQQLPEYYGLDVAIKDPGFLASEIYATLPIELNRASGIATFNNNFFEFVALDDVDSQKPVFYTLDQVEQGKQYYLYITNESGLYRYNMQDIVEIEGSYQNVPMFKFIQRAQAFTDICGEKITEQQIMQSVEKIEKSLGLEVSFYIAFANKRKSGYELYIQSEELSDEIINEFSTKVDRELQILNKQYKKKRAKHELNSLKTTILKERSFEIYKKYKVQFDEIDDTQFKMNYLTQSQSDIASLHSNIRTNSDDDEAEENELI